MRTKHLICVALAWAAVFGGRAAEGVLNWAPEVKKGIDDLVRSVGRDSPGYDANCRPYAVFDFDNTTCIFDIQYQAYVHQLETMGFALGPEEFRAALIKGESGTLADMIEDAMAAYAKLWKTHGGFSPSGTEVGTFANDGQWMEFASKMRMLADREKELGVDWTLKWLAGMSAGEIYSMTSNSCARFSKVTTHRQTLSGRKGIPSRCGPTSISFVNGITVTPELRWLYRTLSENGIDVWICSGSEVNQIRAAADHFGLHDSIKGVVARTLKVGADGKMLPDCDLENGRCYFAEPGGRWRQGTLATRSNCLGSGKVKAIESAIAPLYGGQGPVAGFMDSTGDFNFCTEFASMRLVVCFNRADRPAEDGGGLVAAVAEHERTFLRRDLAKANAEGDALYLLQGRDENGMRSLLATNSTLRFGEKELRLFKDEGNWSQLRQMAQGKASVTEAFGKFARGVDQNWAGYRTVGWRNGALRKDAGK